MRAAERIHTLERALQVRHWARGRKTDEMVLPFFEQLDREQFKAVMDEFYVLQGWDIESGWPARERLCELGLPMCTRP